MNYLDGRGKILAALGADLEVGQLSETGAAGETVGRDAFAGIVAITVATAETVVTETEAVEEGTVALAVTVKTDIDV